MIPIISTTVLYDLKARFAAQKQQVMPTIKPFKKSYQELLSELAIEFGNSCLISSLLKVFSCFEHNIQD